MDPQPDRTIPVVTGTGTGSTELSAFDAALRDAGVANFNLVRLSSVVPPRTSVDTEGTHPVPAGAWGDRLYCVYAEQRASVPGEQAWAGIGWVQRVDGEGGLFVEHEGDSEEIVAKLIDLSLADLVAGRPESFGPVQQVRTGVTCTEEPVCALVVAAYETAGWEFAR
ncbi:pyruvoyl-dependent arginine decarboxylase [Klenkia brasiliensis]|uniref:Pyruvoyl-dependent arginine decarboxylase AaxB n=1 Tax=Klenkia brasiliensis TaxID=333142 RepID=A0A1G7XY45_9ACTN|nr:pyruvoyl-dependent arginine decarboxylase [Klenkia brasiliensis]SDG89114.1 arginine decarboxylase [Klenkia brasiliensis]